MARNRRLYQLSHCTYLCTYHIVWTPKYRGKVLREPFIKQELKRIIRMICKWKEFPIQAWHIGDERIHLVITIPPKYSVSYAILVIKGKSSSWIKKKTKKFPQGTLWNRGFFVSSIGLNEHAVRNYVKNQQHHQIELIQQRFSFWNRS